MESTSAVVEGADDGSAIVDFKLQAVASAKLKTKKAQFTALGESLEAALVSPTQHQLDRTATTQSPTSSMHSLTSP